MATNTAMAEQVGVVGLYKDGADLNKTSVAALGCNVEREGIIFAAQGELSPELPQPDQFIVLTCDKPILETADLRNSISNVFTGGEAIAVLEGSLLKFKIDDKASEVVQRQYIMKLGYFNNTNVAGRESDAQSVEYSGIRPRGPLGQRKLFESTFCHGYSNS